jgi:hypothetical protein
MVDSEFWRNLANEFRAPPEPASYLSATWITLLPGNEPPYKWALVTEGPILGGSRTARVLFEVLARRAGAELGAEVDNPNGRDLLDAWLDVLKKEIPSDTVGHQLVVSPNGTQNYHANGRIKHVCQGSADLCNILESRALEMEANAGTEISAKPVQFESASSELRALGLTIDIDENAAARIWGGLQIIDGRYFQGHYHKDKNSPRPATRQHLFDAYHTIAENIVNADTRSEVLENMIPSMVSAFRLKEDWWPRTDTETLKRMLQGPVNEWKGKRLLMRTEISDHPPLREPEQIPQQSPVPNPGAAVKEVPHIKTDPIAEERAALLIAFKAKARRHGITVTDAMVAKAAKKTWNTRTMVTWWSETIHYASPYTTN